MCLFYNKIYFLLLNLALTIISFTHYRLLTAVICDRPSLTSPALEPNLTSYTYNSTIKFRCGDDLYLEGPNTCPSLTSPALVLQPNLTSYTYNSTIKFRSGDDLYLEGANTLVCHDTASLLAAWPQCSVKRLLGVLVFHVDFNAILWV